MGIISAIGNSVEENYNALISGKMGVTDIEYIDTVHKNVIKVGEIKFTNQQLAQQLQLPTDNNFQERLCWLLLQQNKPLKMPELKI